jgi:hypothetical protein
MDQVIEDGIGGIEVDKEVLFHEKHFALLVRVYNVDAPVGIL